MSGTPTPLSAQNTSSLQEDEDFMATHLFQTKTRYAALQAAFKGCRKWPRKFRHPIFEAWERTLEWVEVVQDSTARRLPRRYGKDSPEEAWVDYVRAAAQQKLSLTAPWSLQKKLNATGTRTWKDDYVNWYRPPGPYTDSTVVPGLLTRLVVFRSVKALTEGLRLHGPLLPEEAHDLWQAWLQRGSESQLSTLFPALQTALSSEALFQDLLEHVEASTYRARSNVCSARTWCAVLKALTASTPTVPPAFLNALRTFRTTSLQAPHASLVKAALHLWPDLPAAWHAQERKDASFNHLNVLVSLGYWAKKPLWLPFLPQDEDAKEALRRKVWTEQQWNPGLILSRKRDAPTRRQDNHADALVATFGATGSPSPLYLVMERAAPYFASLSDQGPSLAWWQKQCSAYGTNTPHPNQNPLSLATKPYAVDFLKKCGITWDKGQHAFALWCDAMAVQVQDMRVRQGAHTTDYHLAFTFFKKGLTEAWGDLDQASGEDMLTPAQYAHVLRIALPGRKKERMFKLAPSIYARAQRWDRILAFKPDAYSVQEKSGLALMDVVCQHATSHLHKTFTPAHQQHVLVHQGLPAPDPKGLQEEVKLHLLRALQEDAVPALHESTHHACLNLLAPLPERAHPALGPERSGRKQLEDDPYGKTSTDRFAWEMLTMMGPERWGNAADALWDILVTRGPHLIMVQLAHALESFLDKEDPHAPRALFQEKARTLSFTEQSPFPLTWLMTPRRARTFLDRLVQIDPVLTLSSLNKRGQNTTIEPSTSISVIWSVYTCLERILDEPLFTPEYTPSALLARSRAFEETPSLLTRSPREWMCHDERWLRLASAYELNHALDDMSGTSSAPDPPRARARL